MRWLHIYLSMFGLAAILFFGATGLTLNHPAWFSDQVATTRRDKGAMDPKWLRMEAPTSSSTETDPARQVAKFEVSEHLRGRHGIRGAVADVQVDDRECLVTFKGPGYAADAVIDRETGRYEVNQTFHGLLAVVNDLHKGRDSGPAWSLVVDLSAALTVVVALTGLVLLFYLKLRRAPGLAVGLLGLAALAAVYVLGVP